MTGRKNKFVASESILCYHKKVEKSKESLISSGKAFTVMSK